MSNLKQELKQISPDATKPSPGSNAVQDNNTANNAAWTSNSSKPDAGIYKGPKALTRATRFNEVTEILESTIKCDVTTKLILFCAGILTFTEEDQITVLMSGESAGGKSYIPNQVLLYFPEQIVKVIASASPTAFMHDHGEWSKEDQTLRVNLEKVILLFLDQPHYTLMEKLRPLLSHDRKVLCYKITDKSSSGGNRTKTIEVTGYPTVIFASASMTLDEQEKTRAILLSPETGHAKVKETLRFRIQCDSDRVAFRKKLESDPKRKWLMNRIEDIQSANIKEVVIPDVDSTFERFSKMHPKLAPRHNRDITRIMGLIKAHALLNFRSRKKQRKGTAIVATAEDINAGFDLYGKISEPNELGLPPAVYEVYNLIIRPLLSEEGVERKVILAKYHEEYGRPLEDYKLRREILPALESAGLVRQQPHPNDRRIMLVYGAPKMPDQQVGTDKNTEKDPAQLVEHFFGPAEQTEEEQK